ncbi:MULTISPECIES: CBU_0592 family membrane protein [unclassified Curtobacterium]|uniref:CBU_0592 family membrane protein n=1 Tax=unclassified Curtobacterium TaxID=257496 RepID=UPI003A80457F
MVAVGLRLRARRPRRDQLNRPPPTGVRRATPNPLPSGLRLCLRCSRARIRGSSSLSRTAARNGRSSSCPESRVLAGIVEFLGWFGAVTVLAGYLLFSMGKLPNGPVYQLFNLVGGLAVAINVAAHHAIPSTIVNGIWAIVAVVVLVKMARAERAAKRGAPATEAPVLRTEPPATTAVLPIVGPALRGHEAEATLPVTPAPRLQDAPPATADTTTTADRTAVTAFAATEPAAPTAAAPMTESIPVITATIALALVAAAQDHAEQQDPAAQDHAEQRDPAAQGHADHADHAALPHVDEPQHAASASI